MSDQYLPYVVTHEDDSQTLISIFLKDGEISLVTLATRRDKWSTWGIPEEAARG